MFGNRTFMTVIFQLLRKKIFFRLPEDKVKANQMTCGDKKRVYEIVANP
jgi:hypothetical protein